MLEDLCRMINVAGSGTRLDIESRLDKICDKVEFDRFGNIIGRKFGTSGKTILLDAHSDEIGLIVSEITDKGMLKFEAVGGMDPRILPCTEVTVHAKQDLYGIIGAKPPHLLSEEDKKKAIQMKDLSIDVGLKDPGKLVSIGDYVSFRPKFRELLNDFVCSNSLDNRCGLETVLEAVEMLEDCPHDIIILASSGEELGCIGASGALCDISPDMAIVVDVTFAMTPDGIADRSLNAGSGAALCTGPNIRRGILENMLKIADEQDIPYDIEVEGGDAGTNAGVIQLSNQGVPTVMVSVPLRYMHTPSEVIMKRDMKNAAKLIAYTCKSGGGIT